jgi:beta-lactamase class D
MTNYISYFLLLSILIHCTQINQNTASKASVSFKKIDCDKYFKDCKVEGSIVIYDKNEDKWLASDTSGIMKETLPASTFKIMNLLIALETGVIKNEMEVVKWPGKTDTLKYGYRPEIYHNMTVKEAFEVSAGWVFIELAKKIGRKNYQHYLKLCNYGNQDLTQQDPDFWNFGRFAISPINQIDFLRAVYEGRTPFSEKNIQILKKVMITEKETAYTISAKTGWTRDKGINTGWWVGFIETKTGVYFFATRLLQDRKNNNASFGACRKNITKLVLKDLQIIPHL